jgi:hypothetical protein
VAKAGPAVRCMCKIVCSHLYQVMAIQCSMQYNHMQSAHRAAGQRWELPSRGVDAIAIPDPLYLS